MSLLDQSLDGDEWVAVNSILWAAPPRGYAARLLREWKRQVIIEVRDEQGGIEFCCIGYFHGAQPVRDRSGFPPKAVYVVHEESIPRGAAAFAVGPHPISFVRQHEARKGSSAVRRDEFRKDYLQALSHLSLPDSVVTFPWTDAAKFRADAEDLFARVRKSETDLRQVLLERGLVDQGETAIGKPPEFVVVDERHDRRIPLPTFSWLMDRSPEDAKNLFNR